MINNRISESCESFSGPSSFDPKSNLVQCYNPLRASCGARLPLQDNISILGPELSLPCQSHVPVSIYQVALNVLSCLDTLSLSLVKGLTVENTHTQKEESPSETKVEDFSFVGRFEGYGGGWGYSGHSVEAIVFSTDTDVVVGGFGLFGGRGEYIARIKLMELGSTKLSIDMEGSLKAESEEKTYECGTKEEFPILFDEPIPITAGVFYLAWAKINGPSSDCGSGGQAIVTTDDKITFQFLSSRKSNNGTDVSAGQIPKIYYRLPHPEQEVTPQPKGTDFPLHILTSAFCCTVSPEAFESLLLLLQWAWVTFSEKMQQFSNLDKEEEQQPILKDLTRLSYICTACLRLTKSFVCDPLARNKTSNTNQLLSVYITCKLLRNILEGSSQFAQRKKEKKLTPSAIILEEDIIDECQRTFIHCFHAFCPTSQLKWVFFCELLGNKKSGSQTLLTAVLGALCDPSIKLTRVLPLLKVQEPDPYPFLKEKGNSDKTALEDSSPIGVDMDRGNLLTDLVSHIESSLKGEQQVAMNTSFQEILDQLLQILSVPIRTALEQKEELPVHSIQTNTSNFLVCVIGELASLATNCESSVQIAGICVYTGLGQYNYELELLDGVEGAVDAHGPRWNSLEFARGVFSGEDAVEKLVEVKFDKPVSVKEGVKYAIRSASTEERPSAERGLCPATNQWRTRILYQREVRAWKWNNRPEICCPQILQSSPLFSHLLPMTLAYIGPVAASHPKSSVQTLNFIRDILPQVATLNVMFSPQDTLHTQPSDFPAAQVKDGLEVTRSQRYLLVESDHPYQPATVCHSKVTFPPSVKWMTLEFGPECGTAQQEDSLQLYISAP
ncbi:putative E3 ubiquitin-protein ligase MYCBP2 [Apostichopus japonicus]|uniref:Putative E3 ubiquitin-protein ligase MYCBP2 n=1 Tax=Stichopus japonicus TaxID=307972 RepID=A0A2G8KNX0_STIJA|nr:putative E3 ubiquitin-protein ligase MYCBP2 [Apostichopus japonicus]